MNIYGLAESVVTVKVRIDVTSSKCKYCRSVGIQAAAGVVRGQALTLVDFVAPLEGLGGVQDVPQLYRCLTNTQSEPDGGADGEQL